MTTPQTRAIAIPLPGGTAVSGLLTEPRPARAAYVLAHGAGAGMSHPFMNAVAERLGDRHIATLRYQFPYMEHGSRRPDRPAVAHATVQAAVAEARRQLGDLPLFAGGKSFGGRMTSQTQAETPLPAVLGLIFLGFPLHPANRPSSDRAQHLAVVRVPMLFLQGTRDALAEPDLIAGVAATPGTRATLITVADADHSFHVPARSGRTDAQVLGELCDVMAAWMTEQAVEAAATAGRP
jgi:predicted alpha/beta-hydrolase family hydrolase